MRTGGDNSFAVLSREGISLEMASDTTVRLIFDEDAAGRGRKLHVSQGVVVASRPSCWPRAGR